MPRQFWVIGGEYDSVDFHEVVPGTARVFGPFPSYDDAKQVWRERSLASRSQATTRYSIVSNAAAPLAQPHAA